MEECGRRPRKKKISSTSSGRFFERQAGSFRGRVRKERKALHISLSYYTHIGRRPNNEDALRRIVEGVSFKNAERYFDL